MILQKRICRTGRNLCDQLFSSFRILIFQNIFLLHEFGPCISQSQNKNETIMSTSPVIWCKFCRKSNRISYRIGHNGKRKRGIRNTFKVQKDGVETPSIETEKPMEEVGLRLIFLQLTVPSSLSTCTEFKGVGISFNPLFSPGLALVDYALLDSLALYFYIWPLGIFQYEPSLFLRKFFISQ